MSVSRANPFLEEIIQILDLHRAKFKTDDEARSYLSKDDNQWIDDEILHCMTDRRYFLSNYYFYRDESEGFKGLYPFFDSQEILHEELLKLEKAYGKVRAIVLKARQMGYTTWMVGEFLRQTIFWEHVNGILVSQDEKGASYNMGMYESGFDYLPWWMKPRVNLHQTGTLYNFDEKDEQLRSERPGLKNWVYADNANRPSGVGRGMTFRRGLLDELAFWNNASQLSKALLRTMNAVDGFYVMGSTANGRNDHWHNLWRRAESGAIDWHPIYIPFYRRAKTYSIPILKTEVFVLTPDELEMRQKVFEKESYSITDETFNWMRKIKEEFVATDGDDMLFSQEYTSNAEESFQNSAITAIPRGIINRYSKRTSEPRWVGEIYWDFEKWRPHLVMRALREGEEATYPETEDRLHLWEKPRNGEKYSVGVDVSLGNKGADYSCITVIKLSQGHELDEHVATWHGYIHPEKLAEIVLAISWYYNEALAAVEVNSMGMTTNTLLMRDFEYENIYRFKRMDRLKHFLTDIVGWWTDYKSKRALISKTSKAMLEDQIIIRDKFFIDELRDFTEDGAEGEGAHDDYVMSFFIALYCGHEGEFAERRSRPPQQTEESNKFFVKNRDGVVMLQTTSQHDAERYAKKIIGSVIERVAGATAELVVKGKKVRIPADFNNTEFSPVHDGDGPKRKLFEEGIPAEMIDHELVAQYEAEQEEAESDPEAWKYV